MMDSGPSKASEDSSLSSKHFLKVLRRWEDRLGAIAAPPLPPWFEEPPQKVFEQCNEVLHDQCGAVHYRRTLTALQAATTVAWLCFAGRSDKLVRIIGRNEELGCQACFNAQRIAIRFVEELLRDHPSYGQQVTDGTARDLFFEKRWNKHEIKPLSGLHAKVWTRPRHGLQVPAFSGILFAEGNVKEPTIIYESFLRIAFRSS